METIKVGIIGAGANTRERHIPGFRALEGVEIAVVCNRSEESSRRAAKELGIPRIAMSWKELVEDPEIDAVCIGTWPYLHADATIAALKNGKHVLCEARMAMNLKEAEEMLAVSRKYPDLVAQLVPSPFTLKWDRTIARLLRKKALGRILEVRATHTTGQATRADTPLTWRQHFEYSGINVMSMGIFHEAIQRWIPEDPSWISAHAALFHEDRLDPETERSHHVQIPESLTIVGRYANHARMLYHFSSVESGRGIMEIRINGEAAALRLDLSEGNLYQAQSGQTAETLVEPEAGEAQSWNVEADFVGSIREGKPVELTSFEDGVRYMRFTQRVFESSQKDGARV